MFPNLTRVALSFLFRSVVTSVAFHPENQCVASGSADRTLKMWDIRSHLLIQHYPAHDDEVTSISMHPVSGQLGAFAMPYMAPDSQCMLQCPERCGPSL
jgi:WD40 repeat protein